MVVAPRAVADLERVADWYRQRHPSGAGRFFREFVSVCELLATFPFAGRERGDLSPSLRSYSVHPYHIFYAFDLGLKRVNIFRVLPARSDIDPTDFGPGEPSGP